MTRFSKYDLPDFLTQCMSGKTYRKWLARKAAAHVKRDRRRSFRDVLLAGYKEAIHEAVLRSGGRDVYTGWRLNWRLISTFNGAKAKRGGAAYMRKYKLLPTVDHVVGKNKFEICSWVVNDAKHYLSLNEFCTLCKAVLHHCPNCVK